MLSTPEKAYAEVEPCPIRYLTTLVCSKWKLLIIYALTNQPKRFSELGVLIPDISDKMLSMELSALVKTGFLTRNSDPDSPNMGYALTEAGHKVLPLIGTMHKVSISLREAA